MKITRFKGQHAFLSNFYPAEVKFDGIEYCSVEAGYQSAKSLDPEYRAKIRECGTDSAAVKRLGKRAKLRPCWSDEFKLKVMNDLVRQKFQHEDLKALLLATGQQALEESNWWGDRWWGTCKGEGRNELGKLLMTVREELRSEQVETGLLLAPSVQPVLAKAA